MVAAGNQRGKARSYEYYADFWDDNDITVDGVELVDVDQSTAVLHVQLRWNGSDDTTTDRLRLWRAPDGQLLIVGQDSLDE